jgi:hypothetical protein
MDWGGQNRSAQSKPTDPYVSVGSGRVRSGGSGPAGIQMRFGIHVRVGSGFQLMAHV